MPRGAARAPARRRAPRSALSGPDRAAGGPSRGGPHPDRRPGDAAVPAAELRRIRRYGDGRDRGPRLRGTRGGPRAAVRFAPTEPEAGRHGKPYEFQCVKRGTWEGQMKKIANGYSVTRRRFLRDATLTSLGIVAAACTPGTTPGTSPSGAASVKGGQSNGAWPY